MPQEQDRIKLQIFTDAVLRESTEEAGEIMEELRRNSESTLKKLEAEYSEEAERYYRNRSAEISAAQSHRVAARMVENKHKLLSLREDCARAVFGDVRRRIAEFTKTEEYGEHMVALLQRAVDELGYGFSAEVFLRPEDMYLKDKLISSARGVSLAFSEGSFTLGGLRLVCPSRGRRVDLSFDSSLTDLIGHFSELSGMQME